MGTGELGKWAWIIGLALFVLGGILTPFTDALGGEFVVSLAALLAFLGGMFYLASGDRTAFFIAALALAAFYTLAGDFFGVTFVGDLVTGILGGAAAAAAAGSAGILVMTVYEWIMP